MPIITACKIEHSFSPVVLPLTCLFHTAIFFRLIATVSHRLADVSITGPCFYKGFLFDQAKIEFNKPANLTPAFSNWLFSISI